jgi:uroporphyrinogen-III synthase
LKAEQVRRPTVVVARSKEGNEELSARLKELDLLPLAVETIVFLPPKDWTEVDRALRQLDAFDWIAFTSPRAVDVFVKRLDALGVGPRLRGPRFAAVGSKTGSRLKAAGFKADFVPTRYLTSALGEGLPEGQGRRVLLLRADIGEKALVTTLRKRGFEVVDLALYQTRSVVRKINPRRLEGVDIVVFASPSEVRGFVDRIDPGTLSQLREKVTAACIGPVTARAAVQAGFRSVIAPEEHTVDALVDEVGRFRTHA